MCGDDYLVADRLYDISVKRDLLVKLAAFRAVNISYQYFLQRCGVNVGHEPVIADLHTRIKVIVEIVHDRLEAFKRSVGRV